MTEFSPYTNFVIVVDDEPSICLLVREMLSESGFRVLTANDGLEALSIVADQPDCVSVAILDYSMPGLDCETLITRLKSLCPSVRIVISSGAATQPFRDSLSQMIDATLPKPYTMRELVQVVSNLTGHTSVTETTE